jgi:DNA-directed RNA polymerase specialized sigma24 family protein
MHPVRTNPGRTNAWKRGKGETRALVLEHILKGLTPREIALILDVSTQAVNHHVKRLRAEGKLPRLNGEAA